MKALAATAVCTLFLSTGTATTCEPAQQAGGRLAFAIEASSPVGFNQFWACMQQSLSTRKDVRVEVRVGAGLYRLTAPIEIPVEWAARGIAMELVGPGATLSGAILASELIRHQGAVIGKDLLEVKLPPELARQVDASTDRDHGGLPDMAPVNLLVKGRIRWRTEWPEKSYLSVEGANPAERRIASASAQSVRLRDGMQVQGFLRHDWADAVRSIDAARSETSLDSLTIALRGAWPKYGAATGGRFKLMNSPAHVSGTLGTAFLPESGSILFEGPASIGDVEFIALPELMKGDVVVDLTINGLSFKGARHTAVRLRGRNIQIRDSHFSDNGIGALSIEGRDIVVTQSTFVRHGGTPVVLRGGHRPTLEGSNNWFSYNEIADFGNLVWSSTPGLRVDGVGIQVTRNLIHGGPHAGIFYFGNDHLIQENEIHSIALRTGDVGAIYTGRDWTGRGHRVVGNLVHDIRGEGPLKATGIYLDDQASGVVVTDNLVINAPRGVLMGGGRDNTIENNHFSGVAVCIRADARGEQWQAEGSTGRGELQHRLKAVPYSNALWKSRFPELQDVGHYKPGSPVRNTMRGNTGESCSWEIDASVGHLGTLANNKPASRIRYRLNEGAVGPVGARRPAVPLFVIAPNSPR